MSSSSKIFSACLLFLIHYTLSGNEEEKNSHSYKAKIDFLYWKAQEQGLDYVAQFLTSPQGQPTKLALEEPCFAWAPGVRLSYLQNLRIYDWDISLYWTHFISHSKEKKSAREGFLEQLWVPSPYGVSPLSSSVRWDLYYNTVDLLLGRECPISSHFICIPSFGFRGLFVHQDFRTTYRGGDFDETTPIRLKAFNDYNALGLHGKIELLFSFNSTVSLFAEGTASLFYGAFHISENVGGKNVLINQTSSHLFREKREFWQVTNDLGGAVGIEWTPMISKKCDIALSFAYEISKLFGQNQMRRYANQNPEKPLNNDLGLQGLTLSLGINL